MNIVAEIHGYPPHHNSGAEWMAHHMFRYLVQKGHTVIILLNFNSYLGKIESAYEFEGVKVVSDDDYANYYNWADVIFTHLDKTGKAYNRARQFNKPLIHIVHNDYKNVVMEQQNAIDQFAIYNTKWVKESIGLTHKMIKKSIVIHPPVSVKDYDVRHINTYISLINLNHNKGGDFLIELAKRMPDKKFMGVMGSYGEQHVDNSVKNIHYLENRGDINYVYSRTRILLMPSIYESYGRTAIEASASGIPVICNNTPGLWESMGDAAIYCNRNKIEEWIAAIRYLDNSENYKKHSNLVRQRAEALNPEKELEDFNNFLKYEIRHQQD